MTTRTPNNEVPRAIAATLGMVAPALRDLGAIAIVIVAAAVAASSALA